MSRIVDKVVAASGSVRSLSVLVMQCADQIITLTKHVVDLTKHVSLLLRNQEVHNQLIAKLWEAQQLVNDRLKVRSLNIELPELGMKKDENEKPN